VPRRSASLARCAAALVLAVTTLTACGDEREASTGALAPLKARIVALDETAPGALGVYVQRLSDGAVLDYNADRRWYLASTAKLTIAIAVLQEVESGRLSLDQPLTLRADDKVDGSGDLVWRDVGSAYRVDELLKRMLMDSDNTASNLLVRAIGVDVWNRRARDLMGADAFERLTDFSDVRYDVYAQVHPSARELTHQQLVEIAAAPIGPKRIETLRRTLKLDRAALKTDDLGQAYDAYYAQGSNAATLRGYGEMLRRLVQGELLDEAHTRLLYDDLKFGSYDHYRLEAGLPRTVRFVHKTGTQHRRACHMGVINPQRGVEGAIVVATCAGDLDEHKDAAALFEQVGTAIHDTMLKPTAAREG